jgi:homoserine dehydrogenase
VNKWDFEWIEEYHSSEERQYMVGCIHFRKLSESGWFRSEEVSVIIMPAGILDKEVVLLKAMKKLSLQLST